MHCANFSGEWNDEALAVLAKQPFVVFEKYHKAFEDPIIDNAEGKIAESCRKVKALNPNTDCCESLLLHALFRRHLHPCILPQTFTRSRTGRAPNTHWDIGLSPTLRLL